MDNTALTSATNISMTVPQAWGIIVAVCGVFGIVIIFLVKIVLSFWKKRIQKIEDSHTELVEGQAVLEDRQKEIVATLRETAQILAGVQKSVDANTTRAEEQQKTIVHNDISNRESTHNIRTLLATEFVPKRDFEKLTDRVNQIAQNRRTDDR